MTHYFCYSFDANRCLLIVIHFLDLRSSCWVLNALEFLNNCSSLLTELIALYYSLMRWIKTDQKESWSLIMEINEMTSFNSLISKASNQMSHVILMFDRSIIKLIYVKYNTQTNRCLSFEPYDNFEANFNWINSHNSLCSANTHVSHADSIKQH